jgi:hypothetical protein
MSHFKHLPSDRLRETLRRDREKDPEITASIEGRRVAAI